jgi:hypothetical protein
VDKRGKFWSNFGAEVGTNGQAVNTLSILSALLGRKFYPRWPCQMVGTFELP